MNALRRTAGLLVCAMAFAGCTPKPGSNATPIEPPPNIIVVFADDMGYGDAGCYGSTTIRTPNLDGLARQGVRFTDFYAAQAVCSASRAALLTGCYPNRIGITGALMPGAKIGIGAPETTLAEVCKGRGYATAMYGKWHLGDAPEFMPTHHGFDEFWGLPYSNDMYPMSPESIGPETAKNKTGHPPLPLLESDGSGGVRLVDAEVTPEEQDALTRGITARAVDFVERQSRAQGGPRPFFLYVAHPMPHIPLHGAPEFRGRSPQGRYGDIIEEIDWSVGQIADALRRTGQDRRTLLIFTSDNGPWLVYGNHGGSTAGLREGKGTSWEGGVREPFLAVWPGRIPAGTVCREPAMTIDLLPTVAGLIGAPMPEAKIDGLDIWPLLSGRPGTDGSAPRTPHEALLFYYHGNNLEAIRSGKWKLVFPHSYQTVSALPPQDGWPGKYVQRRCGLELYDLEADSGESRDVAADHPDVVARLEDLANKARADLGDALTKKDGTGRRPPGRIEPAAR